MNQTSADNPSSDPAPQGGGSAEVQPMTPTLMARLFIVPALIVCLLLAVAVVVVLFGSTSIESQQSVSDLLAILEGDSGERTLDVMLLPKAKESWQAAQELAQRFAQKDKFLKPDEIEPTAGRIIALLGKFPPGQNVEEPGPGQQYFLMMAVGRLGTDAAVEPLAKMLGDANWWTRRTALLSLAEMKGSRKARAALPAIYPLLDDPKPAVQIVACGAVANLADRGDATAIRAVTGRLEADREVQWNAAMTLARLGDGRGKMILLNMLDRGYWENLDLEYLEGQAQVRRRYTDVEVANNLRSAIEAAAHLQDAELKALVGKLVDDKSHVVREAARTVTGRTAMKKAEMNCAASIAEALDRLPPVKGRGGCATLGEAA